MTGTTEQSEACLLSPCRDKIPIGEPDRLCVQTKGLAEEGLRARIPHQSIEANKGRVSANPGKDRHPSR